MGTGASIGGSSRSLRCHAELRRNRVFLLELKRAFGHIDAAAIDECRVAMEKSSAPGRKITTPCARSVRSGAIESRELCTHRTIVEAILALSPRTALNGGCGEGGLFRVLLRASGRPSRRGPAGPPRSSSAQRHLPDPCVGARRCAASLAIVAQRVLR
jgi:hypothetical protein